MYGYCSIFRRFCQPPKAIGHAISRPNGAAARDASGQLVIDQDLVNFDVTPAELKDATKIPEDKLCIAEAFVRFAQEQNFDFWRGN